MRNKVLAPILLVLGLFMLSGGFTSLSNHTVTCDGKAMASGDTCQQVDRRADDHGTGLFLVALGSAMTIGGIVWTIRAYRRRPTEPPYYMLPGDPPLYIRPAGGQAYDQPPPPE